MTTTRNDIICRTNDSNKTRLIDTAVKNPWRWQWLEEKVEHFYLKDVYRKIEKSGFAYCIICSKEISYGSRGLSALTSHIRNKKDAHLSVLQARKNNFALPGSVSNSSDSTASYGLHPMFSGVAPKVQKQEQLLVPLPDRIANSEAMVLSFLAEKSLPFALAPDLVDLVKELSKDKKALNSVKMCRTTAAYKLRFGVAKTFEDNLFQDLKTEKFSLNIDESTSNNNEKVVTVLVNYCKNDKFVTEHLKSFAVNTVSSENIFKGIVNIFEENDIQWDNLMSVLLDSCNVMRGKKSGVEVRLREKCPHLLDIDGDSCHHANNAAKQFCKPFNSYLESLFQDIYNDSKWSPDLRAVLKEICDILNIKFTVPQNYVSFRWLSVYDVVQDFSRMYDAFIIFYFSFLKREDKLLYLHEVVRIYKNYNIQKAARQHVHKLQSSLAAKNLTNAGKERKLRVIKKMFVTNLQTKLTMHLYLSVLPLLKEYVKLFQSHTPLIHKLHDKQLQLIKSFLSCFIRPESLKLLGDDPRKVQMFDVKNSGHHLSIKSIFIGEKAKELISSSSKASKFHVKSFQTAFLKAYISCSETLISKMPILNPFLQAVSAIDPMCRHSSTSLKFMKRLPELVKNVLLKNEKEMFELEVQNYQSDMLLPEMGEKMRTDEWWIHVKNTSNYPLLSKMSCALLTCFHGPRVESSFSVMNNVITPETTRLNIETFHSIQSIKYRLQAEEKCATDYFSKKEYLHDPVEKNLVTNMKSACKAYKNEKLDKKVAKRNEIKSLQLVKQKILSKEKAKKLCSNAAKLQRLKHCKKICRKSPKIKSHTELTVKEKSDAKNKTVNDIKSNRTVSVCNLNTTNKNVDPVDYNNKSESSCKNIANSVSVVKSHEISMPSKGVKRKSTNLSKNSAKKIQTLTIREMFERNISKTA